MSGLFRPSRRAMLKVGLAGAATVASPAILRLTAQAQTGPIKIGMPLALTGPLGSVGQQQKRGAEFYAKLQNAKGGLLGRQIELLIEDTAGNPATCVRKAQEMVERRDCRLLTGITLSSEALAVVPKLAEWNSIFISSDNGDGRLTAESLVPNFFRANISGPMGTRAVSLYLRTAKLQKFYALGLDYAWGHNSVQVFEQEGSSRKKEFIGKVFAPTGTKDYSPYITKIRQSGADAVFLVLQGDDNNAFLSQAQQYRLPEKVKLLTEIVDLASIRAVGDASLGLIGSSRYSFTFDHPKNKEFVALVEEGARHRSRHVRGRAVAVPAGVRGRHHQGRQHRGRQAAPGAGGHRDREHQGQGAYPQVRPPGRAAGLHGQGGQEGRASTRRSRR